MPPRRNPPRQSAARHEDVSRMSALRASIMRANRERQLEATAREDHERRTNLALTELRDEMQRAMEEARYWRERAQVPMSQPTHQGQIPHYHQLERIGPSRAQERSESPVIRQLTHPIPVEEVAESTAPLVYIERDPGSRRAASIASEDRHATSHVGRPRAVPGQGGARSLSRGTARGEERAMIAAMDPGAQVVNQQVNPRNYPQGHGHLGQARPNQRVPEHVPQGYVDEQGRDLLPPPPPPHHFHQPEVPVHRIQAQHLPIQPIYAPPPRNEADARLDEALDRVLNSPFTQEIQSVHIPLNFSTPRFKLFDGRTDPIDHLDHYRQAMYLHEANEAVMCRTFPGSLSGDVMRWFKRLPQGSIGSFRALAKIFSSQYRSNCSSKKSIAVPQQL